MTILEIVAVIFTVAALFRYINLIFLKLEHSIGLLVLAFATALTIVFIDALFPGLNIAADVKLLLEPIDLRQLVLNGFLSAILFAGAIHIDLNEVLRRRYSIILLATLGVVISTMLTGVAMWAIARAAGFDFPIIWALLFGALISPTDPIAVLAVMRNLSIPALLRAQIEGEALLNDGMAIVLFTLLLQAANAPIERQADFLGGVQILTIFVRQAFGGAALGFATGLIALTLMRRIDEYDTEVMITLALVTGTYSLANRLEVSGPISVVVAGALIGHVGTRFIMSDVTRRRLFLFWELIDTILNSVLFLLIGIAILFLGNISAHYYFALAAIPIVIAARFLSTGLSMALIRFWRPVTWINVLILTWGGLRGGISVALALSLPDTPYKQAVLTATYLVVAFTILVQGVTFERLVRLALPED